MPSVKLSPLFNDAQLDNNGIPLSGGQVYWYIAGTTTPVTVYTESTGSTVNTNPVILNTRGEPTQPIWLPTGQAYKAVLTDANNGLIRTVDNISGVNDTASPIISEWVLYAGTATYINATQFSVVGDATATFDANRRVRATVSGTDRYGTVNGAPIYTAGVTTVTLVLDSGVLDSSLATVYYGFMDPAHASYDAPTKPGIQAQAYTAFTTSGTTGVYTLTPSPAIITYASGQRFNVTFNAVSAPTNTVAVNGLAAKSIKMYDSTGTKVEASFGLNQNSDIMYDGTDFVLMDAVQALEQLMPITVSQSAGAMILTLNPTSLDFRNANTGSNTVTTLSVSTAITLTIPSTATLGTTSAVASKLLLLAINNAGTIELAVCNAWNNTNLNEASTINTTTISTGATSAVTNYSTTGRTGVYFRVIGELASTQTTAGTWASLPTIKSGGAWSPLVNSLTSGTAVASTSGKTIDFTNIPSWAKRITIMLSGISTAGASDLSIQIGTASGIETTGYSGAGGYGGTSATVWNSIAFVLSDNITAAQAHSGIATLCLLGSNTWVESGTLAASASYGPAYSGGTKTLAGTLDRIRLTTTTSAGASGIDTFDAGTINIMYE